MTTLPAVCAAYTGERILAADYEKNLARVSKKCQGLSAESVNRYLKGRIAQVSAKTVSNERAMILILWRWAYENRMVDEAPRGVAKVKVPCKPVKAWTIEQCCTAVKCAESMRGRRTKKGADLGAFLRCWILLGYATGARWKDLWSMSRDHVDGNILRYTQNKTGNDIVAEMPENCAEAVREMLQESPDGRILGWVCGKRRAMRIMREHLRKCRLSGSSKWLRRSAATHIERQAPGKARVFLGHKTPTMVRHYLDMGQLTDGAPKPPELE